MVKDTLDNYSLNMFVADFQAISAHHSETETSSIILDKYNEIFDYLKDFYFDYSEELLGNVDSAKNSIDNLNDAFFFIYTAATLGHPRARVQYAVFYL